MSAKEKARQYREAMEEAADGERKRVPQEEYPVEIPPDEEEE